MYNLADFPIETDFKIKMNRFWRLFWIFFKIGAFTLGSGYAMMPQIRRELVTRMKWLDEDEFIDIVAVTQSAPGPIAVNLAVFLGLRVAGIKGIIAATLGSVLPSFVIILAIAVAFQGIQDNPHFIAAFKAVKPASVALILVPVFTIAKRTGTIGFKMFLSVAVACLIAFTPLSPIYVVVTSAAGGIFYFGRKKS